MMFFLRICSKDFLISCTTILKAVLIERGIRGSNCYFLITQVQTLLFQNSNSLLKMELEDVQKVHTFHTLDEIFTNQVALSHIHFPLFFMILLVLFKRHHYVTLRFFAQPTNFGIEHSALLNE